MAVKIRLSRIGTTNRPFYRVIATDARSKRDGAVLANVGTFDPLKGSIVQFNEELYQEWISKGAIATDSAKKVFRLYKKSGIATPATGDAQSVQTAKTEEADQAA